MYLDFYDLNKKPFQISADPFFLWMGEKHKEALAMLKYGVMDNRGFIMLTGDVGTGKTTLINALKNSLGSDVVVANITDPGLEKMDFFNYLAAVFGFGGKYTGKSDFLIALRKFLEGCADSNRQALLIIDEAQRLGQDMLEEIRVLSNIERQDRKLLNIFLVGQDELNDALDRYENRALRQRMTLQYRLEPLTEKEIGEFIQHRLKIAGTEEKIFSKQAVKEIFAFSKGYPRLTNIICDHAMLAGYVNHKKNIDAAEIRECAADLKLPKTKKTSIRVETRNPESDATGIRKRFTSFSAISACSAVIILFLLLVCFVYFPIRAGASYSDILAYWVRQTEKSEKSPFKTVDASESTRKTYKVSRKDLSGSHVAVKQRPFFPDQQQTGNDMESVSEKAYGLTFAPQFDNPAVAQANVPETDKRYTVTFEIDSSDLSLEDYRKLDKTAAILTTRPDIYLTVRGYSDSTGSRAFSEMLSKLRADIVKNYLVGKGVASDNITAIGMGPISPETVESTAGRRVEVELGVQDDAL